jgi:ribosomal protein S18 acetylase RimI-like enzyme
MSSKESGPRRPIESDPLLSHCTAEVTPSTLETWSLIKDDVMVFERELFGLEEEDLIDAFKNPDSTVVIMRDKETNKVVGFTYTEPVQQVYREDFHPERVQLPHTAYIQNTALSGDYRGHKLVGRLMEQLEAELVTKGYEYLERDAVVANNYAENIQKKYGDRIVLAEPHGSRWGDQVFIRIKLLSSKSSQSTD